MTPIDNISPAIENIENFRFGWEKYSEGKGNRKYIIKFSDDLENNLNKLLQAYKDETWNPSGYRQVLIYDKKIRKISKADVCDHVIESAAIVPYEQKIYDYVSDKCPAVIPHKGTTYYMRMLRNDFYNHSQKEIMYYIALDIIHYFPTMSHAILKDKVRLKIKDEKLVRFYDKVIDSLNNGIALGIKMAQLLGIIYLADFDRLAMRCFDIKKDPEKYHYWKNWYVTEKIATCRNEMDAVEVSQGIVHLNFLFDKYLNEGLKYYSRFVDNIIIRHPDKTFLRIMRDLCLMTLSRDYLCQLHSDYNIRPCYDGIHAGGYVIYPDHVIINKTNKTNLCKGVSYYLSHGYTPEETRIKLSSIIGFCAQSKNIKHLLVSIGMEKTLGKIIKSRHADVPWADMTISQKKPFSDIVYDKGQFMGDRDLFKIYLVAYQIKDSKIEKEKCTVTVSDSTGKPREVIQQKPKKTLVLRYKIIVDSYFYDEDVHYKFAKVKDKNGEPTTTDAEFYSYTGSSVLIDEAMKEFSSEDLPCATVIEAFVNKMGKKFYKFT